MNMVLYQEENWSEVDTKGSSILEVLLPQDTIVIKRPISGGEGGGKNSPPIGYQVRHLKHYRVTQKNGKNLLLT